MVVRFRPGNLDKVASPASVKNAFLSREEITFLPSGCTVLDCIISGGYPFGRVVNIIGDSSTGKTLLIEEAMINFTRKYPKARKPRYRETEAAFDLSYYKALGGDITKVDFGPEGPDTIWQTIESIMLDITGLLDEIDVEVALKTKKLREKNRKLTPQQAEDKVREALEPGLYIIDSMDAVSCEAELARAGKRQKKKDDDPIKGSYNLEKQKLVGELFRSEVRRLRRSKICLIIISQIRSRIGAFIRGEKYTRSCNAPLNFYSSVKLYLADLGKVYETHQGVKRPVAVKIKAATKKSKIGMPFRECVFELRFGYGIDDDYASLDYLNEHKRLGMAGFKEYPKSLKGIDLDKLRQDTVKAFYDVEKAFIPVRGKYAKDDAA